MDPVQAALLSFVVKIVDQKQNAPTIVCQPNILSNFPTLPDDSGSYIITKLEKGITLENALYQIIKLLTVATVMNITPGLIEGSEMDKYFNIPKTQKPSNLYNVDNVSYHMLRRKANQKKIKKCDHCCSHVVYTERDETIYYLDPAFDCFGYVRMDVNKYIRIPESIGWIDQFKKTFITKKPIIGIHISETDLEKFPEYYIAINQYLKNFPKKKLIIFLDSAVFMRRVSSIFSGTQMELVITNNEVKNIYWMGCCNYFITSTSNPMSLLATYFKRDHCKIIFYVKKNNWFYNDKLVNGDNLIALDDYTPPSTEPTPVDVGDALASMGIA
jgi:hypothetical protein